MEMIDEISPRDRQREKEQQQKKEPIGYTGIILDDQSIKRIEQSISDLIPDGWTIEEKPHLTINMGEATPENMRLLGIPTNLYATHIGMSDKAIAILVDGFSEQFKPQSNIPHITIGYDGAGGGRPKDSKDITDWKPLRRKLRLRGYLEEVPMFKREGFN